MKPITDARNILIIKHGALGDFVLALPAMAAIRARFPRAHIALQTTAPQMGLASICPYVDEVDSDGRPRSAGGMLALTRRVRAGKFDIIYDLQNSERTAALHMLLPFGPCWNGVVWGARYRVRDRHRLRKHAIDRAAEQVALTGVDHGEAARTPDLSWAAAKGAAPAAFGLDRAYVLIAASASQSGRAKQWPAGRFAALARRALAEGLTPVFVGVDAEFAAIQDITATAPGAVNLAGKTSLPDLAALGAGAAGAVGNDTGPMFVAAAAGARSVVLYSRASLPPQVCAPRGPGGVVAVSGKALADIEIGAVEQAMTGLGILKSG